MSPMGMTTRPTNTTEHEATRLQDRGHLQRTISEATHRQIQQLRIDFRSGVIEIWGNCRTYYSKQLATTAALKAAPRFTVRNEIRVQPESC